MSVDAGGAAKDARARAEDGIDRCLLCGRAAVERLVSIAGLPLCLHAVAPEMLAEVPRLPFAAGVCAACGHVQQVDIPPGEVVEPVYTRLFASYQSTARTGIGGLRARRFLDFLAEHAPLRGRALEVGCFDGHFLSLLKERGCEVLGFDPSPGAEIAARQLGVEVRQEFYGEGSVPGASFDLFVARQVFEHVEGALAFLVQARAGLRPEGLLALELPDADLWLGGGVLGSLFHEHVSYYTEPVLAAAVEAAGFEVVGLRHAHTDLFLVARKRPARERPESSTEAEKLLMDEGRARRSHALLAGYRAAVDAKRAPLESLIADAHGRGGRVALYGGGVHSSSLVAAFGLTPAHVDAVLDDSPSSQGKVLANLDVPIRPGSTIAEAGPHDVAIVSGFSFQEEMLARIGATGTRASVVLLYPEVRVVSPEPAFAPRS